VSIDLKERNVDAENLPADAEMPAALQEVRRDLQTSVIGGKTSIAIVESEPLAALFVTDVAKDFRTHWDAVQSSFVDDPRQAVRQADELVAQVMTSLAETFSGERAKLEGQVDPTDKASTEDLRVALRRYRSFFERLLSL
jgi:hypothetical protein